MAKDNANPPLTVSTSTEAQLLPEASLRNHFLILRSYLYLGAIFSYFSGNQTKRTAVSYDISPY
jgi:hypothetical protein